MTDQWILLWAIIGCGIHFLAGFLIGRSTGHQIDRTIQDDEELPVARIQPSEAIINGKRVTLPLAQLDAVYDAEKGTITYRVNELPKDGAA